MPEMPGLHRPRQQRTTLERNEAHDARRKQTQPWRKWYSTARWRAVRAQQLASFPLCDMCKDEGRIIAATVCDHAERHRGDADRFWNGPFRSLCETHHNRDKQAQEHQGKFGFSIPDGMKPSAVPVHLVCGPAGSGKSTFIKANAKAGDLVIDMDDIRHALGFTRHDTGRESLHLTITERNRMIDNLCKLQGCQAWLIASAPTMAERNAWMRALGKLAIMHVMVASEAECKRRIMREVDAEKRSPVRLKALRAWFATAENP